MKSFLSNNFYNKFLLTLCFIVFLFQSEDCLGETILLEKVDLLHSGLSEINNKSVNKNNFLFILGIINKTYDAEKMGRMIISQKWKSLPSNDQKEFIDVFEKFIATNYLKRFSKIKKVNFRIQSITKIKEKFRLVNVLMTVNDDDKIEFGYLFHLKDNEWFIFDVLVEGSISEIATKKSDFNDIINNQGFKKLIYILKEKNKLESIKN